MREREESERGNNRASVKERNRGSKRGCERECVCVRKRDAREREENIYTEREGVCVCVCV